MEKRNNAVRLLMQKERERREHLRRQAAALAASSSSVAQQQKQQKDPVEASSSIAHTKEEPDATEEPLPASASQEPGEAVSSASAESCSSSIKQQLPPGFFDDNLHTANEAEVAQPHTITAELSDATPGTVMAEVAAGAPEPAEMAIAVADSVAQDDNEKQNQFHRLAEEDEEEEGVVFEIEEPDMSLMLPLRGESSVADINDQASPTGRTTRVPAELASDRPSSRATAPTAEGFSEAKIKNEGPSIAFSGRQSEEEEKGPGENPRANSVPEARMSTVTPSPVTAALLASATSDELRWYRPFDTVFHSELLHEEEELAHLQREAQEAAEKRAAAAREAASAAAAAAVAAAAAAAGNTSSYDKQQATATSGVTKHQLAKRRAAAEAAAAAAAAAETAAAAAAAAAQRAAANKRLLKKGPSVRIATADKENKEHTARSVAVPWGFFDDEEREAAARGLTGPKRLQELLRRAEERRRDMADDLQERKEDWRRHREDVRRFVHGVEEQVQDISAYRMRVECLKQKRRAAAAGSESSSIVALGTTTDAQRSTDATHGHVGAAAETKHSVEAAAGAPGAITTKDEPDLDVARKEEKQDIVAGLKRVKRENGGASRKIRGSIGGGSDAQHTDDSDRGLKRNTRQPFEELEPSLENMPPNGKDVLERPLTKHEFLTTQLGARQPVQTTQEMWQEPANQSGSLRASPSPCEDDDESEDGEDEDAPGDEDDDTGWRAKSLLVDIPVSDV